MNKAKSCSSLFYFHPSSLFRACFEVIFASKIQKLSILINQSDILKFTSATRAEFSSETLSQFTFHRMFSVIAGSINSF